MEHLAFFALQVISKDGGTAAAAATPPAAAAATAKKSPSSSAAVNGDKESANGDTTEEESSLSVQLRYGSIQSRAKEWSLGCVNSCGQMESGGGIHAT